MSKTLLNTKEIRKLKKVFCNTNKIFRDLRWKADHKIQDFIPKLLKNELF